MARLVWGEQGSQVLEAGVSQGVLYPGSGPGVAWNGLIGVNSQPKSGEFKTQYQDGLKVFNRATPQEFSATVEAFTYPDEFASITGEAEITNGFSISEQEIKPFGFSYKTLLGGSNGFKKDQFKIHLVYNAKAVPSSVGYQTLSELPEPIVFSWDLTTTPIFVDGFRPASHFVIDSSKVGKLAMEDLLRTLHGSSNRNPRLPTPDEIKSHFEDWRVLLPSSSTFPSSTTYPGGY